MNEEFDHQSNEQIPTDNVSKKKKSNTLRTVIEYVELFAIAISIVILLFSMVFRTCAVDGSSMNNTLLDGEVLLVSDTFYTPSRGDVIVFHNNDGTLNGQNNKPLVKRIIGIEGDTVTINHTTQEVFVTDKDGNTVALDEEYVFLDPTRSTPFLGKSEYVVPEGKLFVMGDNRKASLDSRYSSVGFVDERSVLGKVYIRLSPISKFGTVK